MANDGQIVFEVTADGKHAIADIKEITRAIQQESKNWDKAAEESTSKIEQSFNNLLKKLVAGFSAVKVGKALLDIGKDALEAASALEEVQNVVDVTFGSDANKIDTWAKNAGTQFGLTETQAKKFTSTLGAMMKSAGMSGSEITDMSTDLAGLAADMASFYNLDFETAFQKIRSGISGETEPLKQLGINMSVANLEAYALSKGITKAFNDMSQGEQTMLRYQYLMQATADAQGDFAQTSDGYANSIRKAETAVEGIKTQLGQLLIGPAADALNWVNDFLAQITKTPEQSVLDKFNDIEIDTAGKLAEIQKVADEANAIIEKLNLIGGSDAGDVIKKIAEGANKLDSSSPGVWSSILGSLRSIDGLSNIFTNNSAGKNVEELAAALSGSDVDTGKAEAWKIFLDALSANADAVSKLTGSSIDETRQWLESLSSAVNSIDPSDADAWDKLLTTLVQGFSADTPEGKQFIEGLATQFLSLGTDSETAVKGLESLGFSTDQITDKQKEWLKYCKQLVHTIPGLSAIINTETGEIKGGTGALTEYVNEWKAAQEKLAYWKAYYAMKEAHEETKAGLYSLRIDAGGAEQAVKRQKEKIDKLIEKYGLDNLTVSYGTQRNVMTSEQREYADALSELTRLEGIAKQKTDEYTQAVKDNAEAEQILADKEAYLKEMFGELTESEDVSTSAGIIWSETTIENAKNVTSALKSSLQEMSDYAQGVHDSVEKAVDKIVGGFDKIKRPTEDADKKLSGYLEDETKALSKYDKVLQKWKENGVVNLEKMSEKYGSLTKDEQKAYDELAKLKNKQAEVNEEINKYKPSGMLEGLQDQVSWMQDYMDNLDKAQTMGLSTDLLAALADGSEDSALYLQNLVADPKTAKLVDAQYQELLKKRKEFTDALTGQQLEGDPVFQQMQKDAKKAVEALGELPGAAGENAKDIVTSITSAVKSNAPELEVEVNNILKILDKLANVNISIDFGSYGYIPIVKPSDRGNVIEGEFETGLNYVPFNGFLASLHEGEGILTAEENRIWQRFKDGGNAAVDYDMMGGVMRDNIKPGGNVYLDGRVVGNVISEQQGRAYRQLQRSGWQG